LKVFAYNSVLLIMVKIDFQNSTDTLYDRQVLSKYRCKLSWNSKMNDTKFFVIKYLSTIAQTKCNIGMQIQNSKVDKF
jgi:hypothetical protein